MLIQVDLWHGYQGNTKVDVSNENNLIVFIAETGVFISLKSPNELNTFNTDYIIFINEVNGLSVKNTCKYTSCSINGAPVVQGFTLPVMAGDIIEIGLAKLSIHDGNAAQQKTHQPEPVTINLQKDKFSELSFPSQFAAKEIAGEKNTLIEQEISDFQDLLPSNNNSILNKNHFEIDNICEYNSSTDPLERLAVEYRRAVQSYEPVEQKLKQKKTHLQYPENKDVFTNKSTNQATSETLDDLLGGGRNINTILDGLDKFEELELFAAEPKQDILNLLTPEHLLVVPNSANLAKSSRRDHHLMSVDSNFDSLSNTSSATKNVDLE